MNREEAMNAIRRIEEYLRNTIYARNLGFSTTRLIFLKYAIDNNIGVKSMNDMQICSHAHKMFAIRDVEYGVDIVFNVLRYIDRAYGFEKILADSIQEYARELFGIDSTFSRRRTTTEKFKNMLAILGQLDLEEKDSGNETGRILVDCLVHMISQSANGKSFAGESITRESLSLLAARILNVESTDVFCDYASGSGLSTIAITKDSTPAIYNVESLNTLAALSAMLYIMYGYHDIHIIKGNSLISPIEGVHGNKIFVDGPVGGRLEDHPQVRFRDISLALVDKAIHNYLDEKGTAVVTVPGNVLFNNARAAMGLRKEMIELGVLKAVVSLPPLWNNTSIGTNLLVIRKDTEPIEEVVFINAMEAVKVSGKYTSKTIVELPDDLIQRIVDTVNDPKTIEGFSFVASKEEIKEKKFNFSPAGFVTVAQERDTTTLAEIDARLDELYEALSRL